MAPTEAITKATGSTPIREYATFAAIHHVGIRESPLGPPFLLPFF
ncbi:hypothetical protein LEP1GSC121_2636 [Leptospira borgpetersenii serovar Castellonis str. 200801910]|nr:hypothetical protein LEP1GSC101_2121 [Leptospira borgpetersenii str. UI 09149]EKQ99246.1 hypothetical protein LEP1GSC121_2636 [Leptospira borgpetersenii serovar Castellonis str. 200801910]